MPWINPGIKPGETRKVMTGIPGKTALIYTLDRQTGEFLWARPTVAQNVVADIDGATGKVTGEPDSIPTEMGQTLDICPSMHGGKDWEAGAYSPRTNTMYFPLRNACMPTLITTDRDASHSYYALSVGFELSPGKTDLGAVYAVSAETGATVWLYEQRASTTSVVATGAACCSWATPAAASWRSTKTPARCSGGWNWVRRSPASPSPSPSTVASTWR